MIQKMKIFTVIGQLSTRSVRAVVLLLLLLPIILVGTDMVMLVM